ncbi:MAG: hypothetical protein NZ901_10450 [Geminocystis sp.]|nr:hypothetical protein [Geminocystis sp.]HIK38727.1 hypothetical protein [Geminocystis sp. M7585_C2015_104]MCS7148595.1 hypothetical protein [Geminocystis sp.]MCX8078142.1 hypothetical protein [Geminocystis sp.]MDW8115013.1 hypothetical protein [Geminocystis sp.]
MKTGLLMSGKTEARVEKPWWNRPLIGERTLCEYLFKGHSRLQICKEVVSLHDYYLEVLGGVTVNLRALFNEKFSQPGFLIFARLQAYFQRYYESNNHYILVGKELFKTVIDNIEILQKIQSIEDTATSEEAQEFFQEVFRLVRENHHKLIFQEKLNKLETQFRGKVEDEKEQKLISNYSSCYRKVSEIDSLINFIELLKTEKLNNWEVFAKIKKFLHCQQVESLETLKPLLLFTKTEETFFLSLADRILHMREDKETQLTNIARIIQYIGLNDKYAQIYPQFQLFLRQLRKWEKVYHSITSIRNQYDGNQFIIPPSFKTRLPGFELYKTYHDYLEHAHFVKMIY